MKQRDFWGRIALFGASVWLLCLLFATAVAAIDTPWVTLKPDSETTGEPDGTAPVTTEATSAEPATVPTGTAEETTAGEEAVSTAPAAEKTAPQTNSPAPEPTKKRGCGSTVSGTIVCVPLLFSALYIGRSVSLKRE